MVNNLKVKVRASPVVNSSSAQKALFLKPAFLCQQTNL
jgi:hypothetical protein